MTEHISANEAKQLKLDWNGRLLINFICVKEEIYEEMCA